MPFQQKPTDSFFLLSLSLSLSSHPLLFFSLFLPTKNNSYIAAMQTPCDGKNDIPNRLKRHFAVFCVPQPAPAALGAIFGPLVRVSERVWEFFSFFGLCFFFFFLSFVTCLHAHEREIKLSC